VKFLQVHQLSKEKKQKHGEKIAERERESQVVGKSLFNAFKWEIFLIFFSAINSSKNIYPS
jgi:hypothetical protein